MKFDPKMNFKRFWKFGIFTKWDKNLTNIVLKCGDHYVWVSGLNLLLKKIWPLSKSWVFWQCSFFEHFYLNTVKSIYLSCIFSKNFLVFFKIARLRRGYHADHGVSSKNLCMTFFGHNLSAFSWKPRGCQNCPHFPNLNECESKTF